MTKLITASILSLGLAASVNCQSVDSDNILTSGMYADISATADGRGETEIRTTLYLERPSSLNYIELEGGDLLTAFAPDGSRQIMRESQFLGITTYSADFDLDDGGTEFIIAFTRDVDSGAPDSSVILPEAFDILNPQAETYSRDSDDIIIDWAPTDSGDDVDIQITGGCIESELIAVEGDPGTHTISAGTLVKLQGEGIANACDLTVTITKSAPGDLDPAYGFGGEIDGHQVRTLDVSSTP